MTDIVNKVIIKVENLGLNLDEDEISTIAAGLYDFLESHDKILAILDKILKTDTNEEIQDNMIALQIELVNHIKTHIIDMENPLMKIINKLD